jgi:hypothetical protein
MIPGAFIFAEKSATRSYTFWHCVHVPLQRTGVSESSNVNLLARGKNFTRELKQSKIFYMSRRMESGALKNPTFQTANPLLVHSFAISMYMTYINLYKQNHSTAVHTISSFVNTIKYYRNDESPKEFCWPKIKSCHVHNMH